MNGTILVATQQQITTLMTNYKEFVSLVFLDKDNDRTLTIAYKDPNGDLHFVQVGSSVDLSKFFYLKGETNLLQPAPGKPGVYLLPLITEEEVGNAYLVSENIFILGGSKYSDILLRKGDILVCTKPNDQYQDWTRAGNNFAIIQSSLFFQGIEITNPAIVFNKKIILKDITVHSSNESALGSGLSVGSLYRKPTGELMIVY